MNPYSLVPVLSKIYFFDYFNNINIISFANQKHIPTSLPFTATQSKFDSLSIFSDASDKHDAATDNSNLYVVCRRIGVN